MDTNIDALYTTPQRKYLKSRGTGAHSSCDDILTPRGKAKVAKRKIIRFTQGAGEGMYKEVIHVSPQKMQTIKKIIQSANTNLEVNLLILSFVGT